MDGMALVSDRAYVPPLPHPTYSPYRRVCEIIETPECPPTILELPDNHLTRRWIDVTMAGNLEGKELDRMLPVRVQDPRWEARFVVGCQAGEEQQQHELRVFTLTGFIPTHMAQGLMLPTGVREMCGAARVSVMRSSYIRSVSIL